MSTSESAIAEIRQNAEEMQALSKDRAPMGLAPSNFTEAVRFANAIAQSTMAPKGFAGKPTDCLVAIIMGHELGLSPMAALQNIAVINGRPSVWGDAQLAIVQGHRDYEWHEECFEGEGDNRAAVFTIKRRGNQPHTVRFSVADAKRAKLWGKEGTWQSYPDRMLQMRPRSWGLRDKFADALRGIAQAEEAADMPPIPSDRVIQQADGAEVIMPTEDPENALIPQIEELLTAKGMNGAQRTVAIHKNKGRIADYLAELQTAGKTNGAPKPEPVAAVPPPEPKQPEPNAFTF